VQTTGSKACPDLRTECGIEGDKERDGAVGVGTIKKQNNGNSIIDHKEQEILA